jgi:phenylacetate-CoA ligase
MPVIGDIYGAFLRNILYPGWESRIRRRPTLQRLAWLEKTQWRSLDELEALQAADLKRLWRHAFAHVPYYRARAEAAGVGPDDIREPRDLAKLPLLTRPDARASVETRVSTAPPLPTVKKATSGTMGQPLMFGYDVDSEYWRQAVKLRGYGWAGYRIGDATLHYWGAAAAKPTSRLSRNKIALDRALKRETYVNCTVRGETELLAAVEAIRRVKPRVLLCYTQAGADLARFINDRGLRDWGTIPVLCGAERLFPADREALTAAFGPAVFETYGCREVMLIGTECDAHDGLHLSSENLIVEVVVRDGERERPAAPGETGEIVITDLHNLGMPFIRYANGDLAMQGQANACACGRALPRIAAVEGRVTETLRDGAGGRVSGLVFNVMFASVLAASVRQFQAVQHKDGSITLKLVSQRPLDEAAHASIRTTCATYLKGVTVRTEEVPEIPIGKSGKRQVVVVE